MFRTRTITLEHEVGIDEMLSLISDECNLCEIITALDISDELHRHIDLSDETIADSLMDALIDEHGVRWVLQRITQNAHGTVAHVPVHSDVEYIVVERE